MLIDLINRFGRPAGNVIVPEEVLASAKIVEQWMTENKVREFCGLTVHSLVGQPCRYEKKNKS